LGASASRCGKCFAVAVLANRKRDPLELQFDAKELSRSRAGVAITQEAAKEGIDEKTGVGLAT